ncbi:hypothetical protein AeMF1_019920 [Aphanomyces euteiches]|nr:hypothetical protein AeMF1_019920 [Aphanomyces euteiches]KAH9183309.1 hypothetical protein AeNC1_014715 [Aphanomyces euteiches]
MKTISILTSVLVPTAVYSAACTDSDYLAIAAPVLNCMTAANATSPDAFNVATASADAITKLCKIDACKTAFKAVASLTCTLPNDSAKTAFTCPSSGSNVALVSGAALALASVFAMMF